MCSTYKKTLLRQAVNCLDDVNKNLEGLQLRELELDLDVISTRVDELRTGIDTVECRLSDFGYSNVSLFLKGAVNHGKQV